MAHFVAKEPPAGMAQHGAALVHEFSMSFPGSCNAFIIFFKIEHLHFFEICPSTSLAFFQVSHTDPLHFLLKALE